MATRAVYFDVGGVLLRTEDSLHRRGWEQRLGLAPGGLAKLVFENPVAQLSTTGGADEQAVWREVGRSLNLPPQPLTELRRDFFAGDRWDLDLLAAIRGLRPGIRTGVISNAWLGSRDVMAEWINPATFDTVVFSADEKCRKPEEKIFRIALERLGVAPDEAMFFDDFPENVEAARKIGIRSVLFTGSEPAIEMLRKLTLESNPR
jgi:FMN phosphatase YigB (HAD superfamily)